MRFSTRRRARFRPWLHSGELERLIDAEGAYYERFPQGREPEYRDRDDRDRHGDRDDRDRDDDRRYGQHRREGGLSELGGLGELFD